jgi:hypothetical protein
MEIGSKEVGVATIFIPVSLKIGQLVKKFPHEI